MRTVGLSDRGPEGGGYHFFLLLLGVGVGVLLRAGMSGGLGWAPWETGLFADIKAARVELAAFDRLCESQRERLEATGVTGVALREWEQDQARDRGSYVAELDAREGRLSAYLSGYARALAVAVAVIMALEAVGVSGRRAGRWCRWATARYALMALWLAVVLATPGGGVEVEVWFVLLLVAVAWIAVVVPLGGRGGA